MNLPRSFSIRLFLILLTGLLVAGMTGCATTESENVSPRPWNSPEGWQNGSIPSGMTSH